MFLKKLFSNIDKSSLTAVAQASTIGMHMISGVIVGGVAGHFLDKWLDSSPWGTVICLLIGIVASFKNVYDDTKRLIATQKEEDAARFSKKTSEAETDASNDTKKT